MFNAASKLYFALAGLAIVVGFGYVVGTADRVGFTNLVAAGLAAFALGIVAFAFVPREPLAVAVDEPAGPRPADATDVAGSSNWPVLAALAVGLVAAGAALEPSLILLGVVVGLIAMFSWFGQVWREHPSWTPAMTDRLNERFVVPFGLPLTIFLLAGIGVVSLSRLFLAVSAEAAPIIGIVIAFALLGAFYLLSTKQVGRPALATLATVGIGLVLAAGVAGALKGEREFHHEGGEGEYTIAADDLAFDRDQLDLPAASDVVLVLENHEAVPHNVSIYEEEGGEALFTGEILNTEGEITYEFTSPAAGTYYFQCDVHPAQMQGRVVVTEEASEELEEGENVTTTSDPDDDGRGPDDDDAGTGGSGTP
ncbi:MAG TPA: cupredoxin domain-containing protein [Acidimicrobiales bacterium]|nr:cupredoxin domain-containing protein [Acidimicrobiales bacterium]